MSSPDADDASFAATVQTESIGFAEPRPAHSEASLRGVNALSLEPAPAHQPAAAAAAAAAGGGHGHVRLSQRSRTYSTPANVFSEAALRSLFEPLPARDSTCPLEEASEIEPGLFLGSMKAAADAGWIRRAAIGTIINCMSAEDMPAIALYEQRKAGVSEVRPCPLHSNSGRSLWRCGFCFCCRRCTSWAWTTSRRLTRAWPC
jgi:hypothetical protein